MADTVLVKDLPNPKLKDAAVQQAMEGFKKNFEKLFDLLGESLKTFEKNELKTRKEYNQLKIDEMTKELKKRGIGAAEIVKLEKLNLDERYKVFNQYYEKSKKALKLNLTELEVIEKKQMAQRIAQNKEFYGKVDTGFKKFNDTMAKTAGALDSVLGVKIFGPLQKLSTVFVGMSKGILKMAMGGAKFISTWVTDGFSKAFKQTKVGQGVSAVGRGLGTAKDFITGKNHDQKREEGEKKRQEETANNKILKGQKDTEKAILFGEAAEEKHRKKWWAWEIMKFLFLKTLDIGKALLGLGTAPWIQSILKWMGPISIGVALGLAAKTIIDNITDSISKNADRQIKALQERANQEREAQNLAKGMWGKLGLNDDENLKLTAKASRNLRDKDESYGKQISEKMQLEEKVNKGWATYEEEDELLRLNYSIKQKLEEEKFTLYEKEIKGNKEKEKLLDEEVKFYKQERIKLQKRVLNDLNREIEIDKLRKEADRKSILAQIASQTTFGLIGGGEQAVKQRKFDELLKHRPDLQPPAPATPPKIGDNTFNLDQQLSQKNIDISSFSQNQKNKFQESKTFLEGLLNKPSQNSESQRTLTIPRSTSGPGRKRKSMFLGPDVDFDGLKPSVKDKFARMSDEYFEKTGHIVGINSANRSLADQIRLYKENPNKAAPPGRSPHQFGYAIDANSWNLNEMDKLGLLDKYGFERKARTKSGEWEAWHTTPKGMTNEQAAPISKGTSAPAQTYYEAGDDVFGKNPDFKVSAKYLEINKKIAEDISSIKNISYAFTKDIPGKSLKDLQKTTNITESGDSKEIIKLLGSINTQLGKEKTTTASKSSPATGPTSTPPAEASSSQGGSAGFKPKSEVFPSDILLMTNFYTMSQFNGAY